MTCYAVWCGVVCSVVCDVKSAERCVLTVSPRLSQEIRVTYRPTILCTAVWTPAALPPAFGSPAARTWPPALPRAR